MTSKRTVRACPECDTARVVTRPGGYAPQMEDEPRYRCEECGETFDRDRLVVRASKQNHDPRPGLPGRLAAMDPDDVDTSGVRG